MSTVLPARARRSEPFPEAAVGLEESAAARPQDWAAAMAFALDRARGGEAETRPLAFVSTADWRRERGRLSARGLASLGHDIGRIILVEAVREADALWALEEALKAGAVAGGVGTVERASFLATRRLDFAGRAGQARAVLLRTGEADELSVARLRWRIGAAASAAHPFDDKAPGALRLHAELTRRRGGLPGAWIMEQDDETHRLRLAAGLAGDGLVQGGQAIRAA
jgi:protein ImuA